MLASVIEFLREIRPKTKDMQCACSIFLFLLLLQNVKERKNNNNKDTHQKKKRKKWYIAMKRQKQTKAVESMNINRCELKTIFARTIYWHLADEH